MNKKILLIFFSLFLFCSRGLTEGGNPCLKPNGETGGTEARTSSECDPHAFSPSGGAVDRTPVYDLVCQVRGDTNCPGDSAVGEENSSETESTQ